ncbi:MAG: hypothetical protein FD165_2544 [Gammaproteobacteria bacterium]|nr:MAG: hypothetical protein FD165_2544 [Gammaproteobacteria bacterium]
MPQMQHVANVRPAYLTVISLCPHCRPAIPGRASARGGLNLNTDTLTIEI